MKPILRMEGANESLSVSYNLKVPKSDRKSLVVFNYALNSDNSIFSHQLQLTLALSDRFNSTTVITGEVGRGVEFFSDKHNVRIFNLKWRSHSKLFKLFLLYFYSFRAIFAKPDVVLYHMVDTHAAIISPLFWIFRIRQILWYAHTTLSLPLRISGLFVDNIITSTQDSFPRKSKQLSRKLIVVGQAIEVDLFPVTWESKHLADNLAVSTGRLDPSKNHELILRTLSDVFKQESNIQIDFIGKASSKSIRKQFDRIIQTYTSNGMRIKVLGSLNRKELALRYKNYSFFIHAFQGSLDKVLLEASLCQIPVITINQEYLREFGSWSQLPTPSLHDELSSFLSTSLSQIEEVGVWRREKVLLDHSLVSWVNKVENTLLLGVQV